MPRFDVHTHLVGGRLGARGLHDILLYHMVISDLYAAGCPSGARLTQYPGWPEPAEAQRRIEEALPYLPRIRNTSCALSNPNIPVGPICVSSGIVRDRDCALHRRWPDQFVARR